MSDFFTVSLAEFLTTLRVVLVLVLYIIVFFWLTYLLIVTHEAVSCFKWVVKANHTKSDSKFALLKDSYKVVMRNLTLESSGGDYWRSSGDWRYYDRKNRLWVLSKYAKEPVYNEDEDEWNMQDE